MKKILASNSLKHWWRLVLVIMTGLVPVGCANGYHYHPTARSPAEGALVSAASASGFFHIQSVQLRTVDGDYAMPPFFNLKLHGGVLVDSGSRLLGVDYVSGHNRISYELVANLSAGHEYKINFAETNQFVTLWVEDKTSKTNASEPTTLFVDPIPAPTSDSAKANCTILGLLGSLILSTGDIQFGR